MKLAMAAVAGLVGLSVSAPAGAQSSPASPGPASDPASSSPATMTLGQVLEVTIRQKPSLELAAIDVAIADAAVLAAAGIDDFTLTGSLQVTRLRTDFTNPVTGDAEGVTLDSVNARTGISRSLPTGGAVSVSASSSFDENPFNLNSGSWTSSIVASITQPLLRGRGSRVARAQRRQAEISRSAAELDLRAQATSALREVILAYWELAYAQRDLEIRRGSLELAKEQLRITRASIDAGATAPTEALAVEQIIATREEEIVAAELSLLQRALTLRRAAGLEIGPNNLALATSAPFEVTPAAMDLDGLLAEAYANSPELASLAKLEDNAAISVAFTDNGTLPRLDASISGGPNGSATSFGSSFSDMVQLEGWSVTGGLTFEHNLGNRGARGSESDARARLTRAKITTADARQLIASSLASAVAQSRAAGKRLELSQRAIELAEKNVKAEQTRFDLGRATNFDIAQRQEELKLAQLRYARAIVDYLSAVAQVDAIVGRIPEKYGVKIDAG